MFGHFGSLLKTTSIYSAGEEKSPYILFHGETALGKILDFREKQQISQEKFEGEIAEFKRGALLAKS